MTARVDPQPGLGKAIRELRTDRKLSQEALGISADVHATWISHMESGRINPTWGTARRIAAALGIELKELAERAEFHERNG